LVGYFAWSQLKRPAGIPPGPRGLPVLGYIPFLVGHRSVAFQKLAKKYGQVFSFYMSKHLTVVINDYSNIRKAMVDHSLVFSGRPSFIRKRPGLTNTKALIMHDGPFWQEHRRFALSTLRDFGIGKSSLEPAMQDEIIYFLKAINDHQGKPFDFADLLGMSVCNNICILEFGKRFNYNDKYFIQLKHAVDMTMRHVGHPTGLSGLLRYLKLKIPFLRKQDEANENKLRVLDFCKEIADEHIKNYEPGSTRDYIDAYLTEKAERERTNNNAEMFDYQSLYDNLNMLFMAGTETTATTLRWGLLFMLMHPDIQRKVQKEIDDVIGRDRLPEMNDRLQLPYTEATLLEIMRRGFIATGNLPRSTTEDVEFNGYLIPKDTIVFLNTWSVHFDEKLFPDPYSFRPERFINEHGQFVKHEAVIPFALGKRFCLGEPLARMELFLYFTSMLQKFTLVNPEGQVLRTEAVIGQVLFPKPYSVSAIPRTD